MFFAGEALYAGPDIGTVGQRPRDGAGDDHDGVFADTTPRPLILRTQELLAEPGILEALSRADRLFIGWFGPRGLATIVFAVLVLDEKLPGNDTMILAAGWTVLISVIAHGVTANPLVKRMAARSAELAA